jgi:hypothetical protein
MSSAHPSRAFPILLSVALITLLLSLLPGARSSLATKASIDANTCAAASYETGPQLPWSTSGDTSSIRMFAGS